jgi:DNA-directed RNA polymerase specialized sigma24 family protein
MTKSEYEIIKAAMDAEDIRIAKAFEMKELFGFSVREIAAELHISEPRVYQLVARARAIGREYRQKTAKIEERRCRN